MIKVFDGSDEPEAKSPYTSVDKLMSHAVAIEIKRQELAGTKTPDGDLPRGCKPTRIDEGLDGVPPTIVLVAMEGSRASLIVAACPVESAEEAVVTHHDGENGTVMQQGAIGLHISSRIALRLSCQLLEGLLPRLNPKMRKVADAFLTEAQSK